MLKNNYKKQCIIQNLFTFLNVQLQATNAKRPEIFNKFACFVQRINISAIEKNPNKQAVALRIHSKVPKVLLAQVAMTILKYIFQIEFSIKSV